MRNAHKNDRRPHPEETGKVPASGVMSETYKEEVNEQDLLGKSPADPEDPEESDTSKQRDLDSYPFEEVDSSLEKDIERKHHVNDDDESSKSPSQTKDQDEFLK